MIFIVPLDYKDLRLADTRVDHRPPKRRPPRVRR